MVVSFSQKAIAFLKANNKTSILQTKPQSLKNIDISTLKYSKSINKDTVSFSQKAKNPKIKNFTQEEILNLKPSEFENILAKREDIVPAIKENITTPEKLNLYDELLTIDSIKNMPKEKFDKAFSSLFSEYNNKIADSAAQLETIPNLIKKGYQLEDIASLPILPSNKNQIEYILKNKDKLTKKIWQSHVSQLTQEYKNRNLPQSALELTIDCHKRNFQKNAIKDIVTFVNDKNVKYLEDCIEITGSVHTLPYWNNDTAKILKELADTSSIDRYIEVLDRLHRRNHNFNSVKQIFGNEKMNELTSRLLEFKNYEKFKNIGIDDIHKLSTEDKKELLNNFISAISPKEAAYRSQHKLDKNFEQLSNKVKIFKNLDTSSNEAFIKTYNDTVRKLLKSIPEQERQIIRTDIDVKSYRKAFRESNPIPTLVDDVETILKPEIREINGRKIKVAQMDKNANIGIATHRIPNDESILIVEALEATDPKMLLCVGTKGGNRGLNFSPNSYAVAMKPRKGNDWFVQAYSDIDSGNNASKNIYNFENIILPYCGNHCDAIDLIPRLIKKKLNLSQNEYTQRMQKLRDCTTLQEIAQKDEQMEKTIREVIKEQGLYEGLMRPEPMGVLVDAKRPLENISDDILNYCELRNIPLIQVKSNPL